jgi:hypothetical protein
VWFAAGICPQRVCENILLVICRMDVPAMTWLEWF